MRDQKLSPDSGSSDASNMIHEIHNLEKKHAKSTHSLFLGSYPKFRDSFGSVDENFNVNEFFKKIISRSSNHLLVSPMIITRDKKTEKMLK